MRVYIYEMNFLADFGLNKNYRGREKINKMRKTSWTYRSWL